MTKWPVKLVRNNNFLQNYFFTFSLIFIFQKNKTKKKKTRSFFWTVGLISLTVFMLFIEVSETFIYKISGWPFPNKISFYRNNLVNTVKIKLSLCLKTTLLVHGKLMCWIFINNFNIKKGHSVLFLIFNCHLEKFFQNNQPSWLLST